jgi:hypothetical protein
MQPTQSRTFRLADLIDVEFAEATAAHEAFRTGQPRGPKIPFAGPRT